MWGDLISPQSYHLNIHAVPLIAAWAMMFAIGIFILVREGFSRVARALLILMTFQQTYFVGLIGNYLATTPQVALAWQHFSIIGLILLPPAIYQYSLAVTRKEAEHPRLRWSMWAISGAIATISLLPGSILQTPHSYSWGHYFNWSWLALALFPACFGLITMLSLTALWRAFRDRNTHFVHRRRVGWVLVGGAISSFAILDIPAGAGIALYPAGYVFVFTMMLITALVTLRYRLVDITPAFAARRIIDTMHDALLVMDEAGVVRLANRAATRLLGRGFGELIGRPMPAALRAALPEPVEGQPVAANESHETELSLSLPGDHSLTLLATVSVMKRADGEPEAYVAVLRNLTDQRTAEERARRLARYDSLTHLPNRRMLREHILAMLASAADRDHGALMMIDLDHFKRINDSFDHDTGDRILLEAASRLRAVLARRTGGAGDMLSRPGGDEFLIALGRVDDDSALVRLAEDILAAISHPMTVRNQQMYVGASIGISRFPQDATDVDTLLRNAETAMYHAKSAGRNRYQFFDPAMNAAVQERLTLELDLRQALARNELMLHYQPQVNIHTGKIEGVEALLRWKHPTKGMISPGVFIPVAEESGLIVPIGEWILKTACAQATAWQKAGCPPIRLAVNLSAKQFQQPGLEQAISQALAEHDLDAGYLELEITESVLMQGETAALELLSQLRRKGHPLTIDDFGTGYSSLSYLKRFPLTGVKIDHSFVRDLPDDPDDVGITLAILAMAASLGLEAVPEGIETQAQLEFLRHHHRGLAQGFLFARPMPAEEIQRLLEADQPLAAPVAVSGARPRGQAPGASGSSFGGRGS